MYYALPYVPHPIEHKSFKHLFTEEFYESLNERLRKFLEKNLTKMP
jgi:hypothetical protein